MVRMDWFEFLEEATRGLRLNSEAAGARRELRRHLEAIRETLLTEGWSADAAEEEALRRMGRPEDIAAAFAYGIHPMGAESRDAYLGWKIVVWALLAMAVVAAFRNPWWLLGAVPLLALLAILEHGQEPLRTLPRALVRLGKSEWPLWGAGALVGLMEALRPVWFSVPAIPLPTWVGPVSVGIILLATGWALLAHFMDAIRYCKSWRPANAALILGAAFALVSVAGGVAFGAIWPYPPAYGISWYGLEYLRANSLLIGVYPALFWLIETGLGTVWRLRAVGTTEDHAQRELSS